MMIKKSNKLLNWFGNGSEITYHFDQKTYRGRANQHRTNILREPKDIYNVLIDPEQMNRWCPFEQILVKKITPCEFRIGTKLHFKLRFRIQPEWDSRVIHLEKDRQIVYQFLNGIFEGGIEIWDLKKTGFGTEVTHTLLYQIKRWIYKVGWFLLGGEKKHDELTELALLRLKSVLERDVPLGEGGVPL